MELWETVVLGAVGETLLSDNSIVNGVKMVNKTRGDDASKTNWRLEVWLSVPEDDFAVGKYRKELEKALSNFRMVKSVDHRPVQ
jgi:hypothetical protein